MDMKYAIYAICLAFSELILQGSLQKAELCEYMQIPYGLHPLFFNIKVTISQPVHIIFCKFYLDFKHQRIWLLAIRRFSLMRDKNTNIAKD